MFTKGVFMKKTTKEKILEATFELIAKYGYKEASMRKIAKEVGVRESAIYNHFKNKEEIFSTILNTFFKIPFEELKDPQKIEKLALKGKKFLYEYATAIKLLSFDIKNEKLFKIILLEFIQNDKIRKLFLEHFFQDNIKALSHAFFIMMQNSLIKPSDPILTAREFYSPLFYTRIEIILAKLEEKNTAYLSTLFEKHVDYFWENISLP
jgi:AcrR family transcriptional regulator